MKKGILGLCMLGLAGIGCLFLSKTASIPVVAEGEGEEIVLVEKECKVVIDKSEHGTITADKTEGDVGEIVQLTVKSDLLYLIESVSVNGSALVESETTKGEYSFALVSGENKVSASFAIDKETLGVFSEMAKEASEKDWKNLFTIENVITLVKWVLDGGILLVMARYFIRDKKLSKKVENTTRDTLKDLVPETTKQAVVASTEQVLAPIFAKLEGNSETITQAVGVLAKCMALAQQDTPEARSAIINELTNLKIGDKDLLAEIKEYIAKTIQEALNVKAENIKALEDIEKANKEILKEEEHSTEENTYDGTTI